MTASLDIELTSLLVAKYEINPLVQLTGNKLRLQSLQCNKSTSLKT